MSCQRHESRVDVDQFSFVMKMQPTQTFAFSYRLFSRSSSTHCSCGPLHYYSQRHFAILASNNLLMPPRDAVVEVDSPIAVRQRRRRFAAPPACHEFMFPDYNLYQRKLKRSMSGTSTAVWVKRCWHLHFGVSLSVLLIGCAANSSFRYVSVQKYIGRSPFL